jgi:glutaredoxin
MRARMLLASRGVDYEEIQGSRSSEFRAQLAALSPSATAPQIVIGGRPIGGAAQLARLDRRGVLMPLVRGERFPWAVATRRLSPGGMLRSLLGLRRAPGRGPWQYEVALINETGNRVETRDAPSAEAAAELAASLNAG